MRKTWLSAATALVLIVLSIALILGRRYALGPEIDGTPGIGAWKVTLEVEGKLAAPDASVILLLPPDFRRQHITDESFDSDELTCKVRRSREAEPRRALWQRRPTMDQARPFRLIYSFRCVLGMRRPTVAMAQRTQGLDAPPREGYAIRPAPLIESDHEHISRLAASLAGPDAEAEDQARALFDHVAGLALDESGGDSVSALACLRQGGGDSAARSRLLVALCRNRELPARLVSGLVLESDGKQTLHHWAEVWVGDHWLPMCPTHGHFGARRFPENYLVLLIGGEGPVRGERVRFQYQFAARDLHNSLSPEGGAPPSAARILWRKMTLGNLRPEEQEWVKFLLLLPLAALIVSVARTVIGIATFGTFAPALLGLVCRNLKDLPWALGIFVLAMLIGWAVRRVLDRYHLLMVPRVSVLLTVIVALLIVGIVTASPYGWATNTYVALLPLVILTHMVERFWTVEAEDGTGTSLRTLLGTVAVAVVISLVVNVGAVINALARLAGLGSPLESDVIRTTLFRYPESLGLVLAALFLVGRYTGYRLTELFRFRDLMLEGLPHGGRHELAGALPAPQGDGRTGHEPAQHGVHPGP